MANVILDASPCLNCGEGGGGECGPGEECLPSDFIDPDDCPGCDPGTECLPTGSIPPEDCPECGECCTVTPDVIETKASSVEFGGDHVTVTFDDIPLDDDVIVVLLYAFEPDAAPAVTWPAGFTEMIAPTLVFNWDKDSYFAVAWKRANGEGSAAYQIDYVGDPDGAYVALGKTWRGVIATGTPFVGPSTIEHMNFGTTSVDVGDVTTVAANSLWEVWKTDNGSDPFSVGATRYLGGGGFFQNSIVTFSRAVAAVGATGDMHVQTSGGGWGVSAAFGFALTPDCSCPSCGYRPYCLNENDDDVQTVLAAMSPFALHMLAEASAATTAVDSSGNGNDGGLGGTRAQLDFGLSAKMTKAFHLAANSGQVGIVSPTGTGLGTDGEAFAIAALIRLNDISAATNNFPVWLSHDSTGANYDLLIIADGDDTGAHLVNSRNEPICVIRPDWITLDVPFVLVMNGPPDVLYPTGARSTWEFWIDGVLVTSGLRRNTGDFANGVIFGQPNDTFFGSPDMDIGPIVTFDRALTPAEIKTLTEVLLDSAIAAGGNVPA